MGVRIQVVCQRLACRRRVEIEVATSSGVGDVFKMPCLCGAEMKKTYSEPVFRELSQTEGILGLDDSVLMKTQS
jgi:hypothetical protein